METIIKYLKLPFSFDSKVMLEEVKALTDVWLSHYNSNDYSGDWKAIPLRSVHGTVSQAYAYQGDNATFTDTIYMQKCPHIEAVVGSLQCEKTAIRLLNMLPATTVKEHKDPGLTFEEGEARLHIPLITNEKVEFYIEDELVKPMPGECWYMNFGLRHRLSNNGTTNRIHLVIDCIVNDWLKDIFASIPVEDKILIDAPERHTQNEKRKIIEQLKVLGTDVALLMAKELENELMTVNQ